MGYVSGAPVVVLTGMAFEAKIATGDEALHGLRGDALERALDQRLAQPCAGLISFGMAGGLAPDLTPGALIVVRAVADGQALMATDSAWCDALLQALHQAQDRNSAGAGALAGIFAGIVAGVDAPAATVADKQALYRATGALAVDMESHIGARAAQRAGVPYAVCRVVLDPAQQAVPPAALAAFG
ncbi:phosphorylase family protein, partial [Duganella callida]